MDVRDHGVGVGVGGVHHYEPTKVHIAWPPTRYETPVEHGQAEGGREEPAYARPSHGPEPEAL